MRGNYFDYLQGRVMKVRIQGDELDPRLYDRDNGEGAAEQAIWVLRQTGDPEDPLIQTAHRAAMRDSALETMESGDPTTVTNVGGMAFVDIGGMPLAAREAARRALEGGVQ